MTRDQALRVDRRLCGSFVRRQASTRGDWFRCHRSYCWMPAL